MHLKKTAIFFIKSKLWRSVPKLHTSVAMEPSDTWYSSCTSQLPEVLNYFQSLAELVKVTSLLDKILFKTARNKFSTFTWKSRFKLRMLKGTILRKGIKWTEM